MIGGDKHSVYLFCHLDQTPLQFSYVIYFQNFSIGLVLVYALNFINSTMYLVVGFRSNKIMDKALKDV